MIAITIDVDWSPDPIVESIVELLDRHGVPCTLYCTDFTTDWSAKSSSLRMRYGSRHEIGVHPNFQFVGDYEGVWDQILNLYPDAKGFRSHNGCTGWPISLAASRRGLLYEVYCTVYPSYVPPFKINRDVISYYIFNTYFFDSQMLTEKDFDWSFKSLWFADALADADKLFILGFHPNILYYDMTSVEQYELRKPSFHVVAEADSFKGRPLVGAMKFLTELLESFPKEIFSTPLAFGRRSGLWP